MRSLHIPTLALVVACIAGACFLPDIDVTGKPCPCPSEYQCDESTHTCTKSPPSGSSASGSTSSQGGASMGSSTSTGGAGGGTPLSNPLVIDSDIPTGALSLSVANGFRIQATPASHWQWLKWYDLANGNPDNLASTYPGVESQYVDVLLDPMYVTPDFNDWFDASSASVTSVTLTDQTPARCVVDTTLAYGVPGIQVETVYVVYASGRIASTVQMKNIGGSAQSIGSVEYNYASVNPNLAPLKAQSWSKTSYSGVAGGFIRTDGPSPKSSLLVIDETSNPNLAQDSAYTNWYWGDPPSFTLQPGDTFDVVGELQLGPGNQTGSMHAARADDVLGPGLDIVSGGTPIGSGFDEKQSAYVLQADAGATSVVFGPTNATTRFSPAFVVQGFTAPAWHVLQGGTEIVSSAELVGHGALAHTDGAGEIIIVLDGQIPAGASDAQRLLTLEAQ